MNKAEYQTLDDAFAILKRLHHELREAGEDEYGTELVGDATDALGSVLFEIGGNVE